MADNTVINAGAGGDTIATDDIGGVKYQRVKLGLGADGTAVDAVAGAGAVGTGVQRVTLASDDPVTASVQIMDDWDESDRAKVNLIVGQAGIAAGSGAAGATVPRVVLATDDPAVTSLAIMDDWDETDRAKVNIIAGQAGVAANSGTASASTVRVTQATDIPVSTIGFPKTVTATSQRPGDTTTYTVGDAWGTGFTLTDVARQNGGTIIIQDIVVGVDEAPTLKLTGRIYIFDASVTASTDNAALVISDTDYAKIVGYVDFGLADTTAVSPLNSVAHLKNLAIECTTVTVDDLFCLVHVTNAYVPGASATLTVRVKFIQVN